MCNQTASQFGNSEVKYMDRNKTGMLQFRGSEPSGYVVSCPDGGMQCALKIYFISCYLQSFLWIICSKLLTGSQWMLPVYHIIPIVTTTYRHSELAMFLVCVCHKNLCLLLGLFICCYSSVKFDCVQKCVFVLMCARCTRNCVQHILQSLLTKSLIIKLHFCMSSSPCCIILVTDTLQQPVKNFTRWSAGSLKSDISVGS